MKHIYIYLQITVLLLVLSIAETNAQPWISIDGGGTYGISSTTGANANYPSVAVFNGELYAIWQENFAGVDQIHVKKYNGSAWAAVGDPIGQSQLNINASNAWSPKIVTYNGALYAAWYEYGDGITRIRVKKYNGSTWTFVENYTIGDGRTNINNLPVALAIKVDIIVFNNELYATWVETEPSGSGKQQIRVAKYNGSVWSSIDGGTFWGINYDKAQNATNSTLCVFNNTLYAAWTENTASNVLQLRVKRYDGGSVWTFVDGNGPTGLNYSTTTTLYDGPLSLSAYDGKMYAFWAEDNRVRVKRYDETNGWVADPADGGTGIGWCHSSTNVAYYPFSFSYDKLYVTWEQNPIPRQVRVASYDGTTRTFIDGNAVAIGINNTPANRAHFPKLIDYNGDLVAVWSEELNSTQGSENQIRAKIHPLPPLVKSVTVPANGTYINGQNLSFTVNFSKSVIVASGTPYIPVTLNTGGTVMATYASGSGSSALTFRYTIVSGQEDADGISLGTAIDGGTLQSKDATPLTANLKLNNVSSTVNVMVDANAPAITGTSLASNNNYIDVTFSEGIYGASNGATPLSASKLSITFSPNGGKATNAVVSSVKKNDNTAEGSASALSGGETTVRVFLSVSGTPSGVETIEIRPANGTSIFDKSGNAAVTAQTTGPKALNDKLAPTLVSAVRTDDTHIVVTLSENCLGLTNANNGGFSVFETGAAGTTYPVLATAQEVDASHAILMVANMAASGKEGVTVAYVAGGNGTIQDLAANTMATNNTGFTINPWDVTSPAITSGILASNNAFIDINFNEGVYGSADGTTALTASRFSLTFISNGGSATSAVIRSIKKNDNTVEGSASALTGGETTVRLFLTITGTPSGSETIEIMPANGVSVYDKAGNAASLAQTAGVKTLNDKKVPTILAIGRLTPTASLTNATSVVYRATFSENVDGVDAADFSLTTVGTANGVISGISGTGLSRDITVSSITGDGTIRLDLKNMGTGIADNVGNALSGGYTSGEVYTIDRTNPIASILGLAPTHNNYGIINFQVNFSENVSGIDISDFSLATMGVTGAISSVSASSGTSVNVTVGVFSGNGTLELHLNNSGTDIKDAAGNMIIGGASSITFFIDKTPPYINTISRVTPFTVATKSTTVVYGVNFSESVSGVDVSDFSLTKTGTATGTIASVTGSGGSYEITVNSVSGNGNLRLDLNDSGTGIADEAGNQITGGYTGDYYTIDNMAPSVVISSTSSNPTKSSPIPVTITFSEPVTGFAIGDITLTNGTASNFSGSGTTYNFNVTPAAQGAVNINVAAGVAADAAGNSNAAATQLSLTYDNIAPTVTLTSSAGEPTKTSPIPVTITFSESVTGFDANDITVTNGTKGTLSGSGASYSINIMPSGQGAVMVNIAGGVATDAAGNGNAAAAQLSRTFDNVSPSVTISSSASETTNVSPIPVTITFSEPVTGFDASDITVTNGTKGTLSGSGSSYTINITPVGQGAVIIAIAAGVATDAAGNSSTAAASLTRNYNTLSPMVTLASTTSNSTNVSPIPITITFSEPVNGFDASDITVTNGTKGTLSGSGAYYTMNITPLAEGTVTVSVAAGVATSLIGNANVAATSLTRTYDIQGPSVTLSSITSEPTNASPMPVSITFSEPVTGFDASDITVTNGTKGSFSGSGASYTINIIPSEQGTVKVDVAAGVTTDAAGNSNSSATQFSRIYDSQAPSVDVTSTVMDPTNLLTIPINIVFSEAVTGFTLSDIIIYGGTASDLQTTDNIHWTASVTFAANMGAKSINIAAGSVQDLAGNGNTAAPYFQRTYDPKPPTVTISSTSSNPTKDKPIVVKMKFSETVVNFKVSNIVVTNGTASNLQTDYYQEEWTADIYPAADGVVTVDLPVGAAQDYAGNNSSAAAQFSRTCDITPPTAIISSASTGSTNSNPIPVNITFSEPVTGFDDVDISVTNGTIVAMSGSGANYTIDIAPTEQGLVTVNIAAGVTSDAVGNNNTVAAQFTRIYDAQSPSVVISSEETIISDSPKNNNYNFQRAGNRL
ncbi:MAG TPA: Ig-like domain-containing protein [Bacteroidales bacterium]|nr:Ig-like domain-containing protein [Bacteroidales bacterium]